MLGYEDQPSRPARVVPQVWRLAPASIGWGSAGVLLLVLGLLARRPDVVAIGAPLLLGLAWSTSSRPRQVPTARLHGNDQPAGTTGTVDAEVVVEPADLPTAVAIRVRAPGHRPAEALVLAEHRAVPISMHTVRTGRREL